MKRVLTQFATRSLFLLITVLVCTQASFATTAVRPSDDDLIIGARAIVRGKVVSIESAFDDSSGRLYTYVTIKVQEVIKGQITDRRIVIKELGGQVGDRMSVVFGNPQFTLKERVFLYLDTWADGSLRTYQMFLGKFSIIEQGASRFVNRDMSNDNVVVLPNPNADPQAPSTDRMELSAYTEMVRARRAATDADSVAFQARYYDPVPLRSEPPEFKRISLSSGFSAQFTLLGNARWFEPDTGQPVPYTVNPTPSSVPGFPPLAVPESDVAAAANAWSVVPGCALRVTFAGQLTQCYTQTGTFGINVVSDNCDGRNAPSQSCAGILAWGGYSGGTSETKVINGVTFQRITQGFISFNPYAVCHFDISCNVQEITTHELGHALGLGHSADTTATMYGIAHFDGRCASIRTDDSNAIVFVYPGSGGGPGPLNITTSTLPAGTVGSAYNQALAASGGTPPYTWSLASGQGSLPTGLNLSSGGVISGTPTTSGTFNFTVKVTDSTSATAQKALSIVISASGTPLDSQFVSQTVPTSVQPGQQFNANLKFLNTGTQTWSGSAYWLVSQNPPLNTTWGGNGVPLSAYTIAPGQQLDTTFTATAPTTPGSYNFQWQLYQNGGVGFFGEISANVVIQVGSAVTITTSSPLPGGTVGVAYSQQLAASGGTPPYSWGLVTGSLPSGCSLNSAGLISGTPQAQGTFNFTVQANDSASGSAQKAFSITIAAAPTPVSITTSSPLPGGTVGVAYSQQLAASGGTPPYSWGLVTGSLPQGLAFSVAGLISGTPQAAGTFNFTVQANDSALGFAQKVFSITIAPGNSPPTIEGPISLAAIRDSMFSYHLSVTGGRAPFVWSIIAGGMPPGLGLNSQTGLISGMPLFSGAWSFTLRVTDADGARDQKNFTINVAAPALLIGDTAIPDSQVESPFTFQLTAAGGVAPYRWALLAGALPPGVALDPNTGLISGNPTQAGTFNFTVSVSDAVGTSASKSISITITAGQLRFVTTLLQSAERLSQYSQAVPISGGLPPYNWSLESGVLPDGLTLDPVTGMISGLPTKNGQWSFSLRVFDRSAASITRDFELMVVDPATVPRIDDANYKGGSQKLLAFGVNFDKRGKCLVDGLEVNARIKAFKVIVYELVLAPGAHEIRVVTRTGLVSNRFVLTVE